MFTVSIIYALLPYCFTIASNSEFLRGKNGMGWVASFDWLIKPENIAKVLNGNYESVFAEQDSVNDGMISSFDTDEFIASALARGFD